MIPDEDDDTSDDDEHARTRVARVITQLITSNAAKNTSKKANQLYQSKARETPVTLWTGLKLGAQRRLETINFNHRLGLSISSPCVTEIKTTEARAVCKQWNTAGLVYPVKVLRNIFVVGAVDNDDENSFHGTAATMTACPTEEEPGDEPPPLEYVFSESDKVKIPESFATIPFADEFSGDYKLTPIEKGSLFPTLRPSRHIPEQSYLDHVTAIMNDPERKLKPIPMTFSGYFSGLHSSTHRPRASIGGFPILNEKSTELATQKHFMIAIKKATEYLNPGQDPIITSDLAIYSVQKRCQKLYPQELRNTVCFMGLLHLEMALQEVGGWLMGDSGWENMFILAGIFTSGVANSLKGGKKVKNTRYAYQLIFTWIDIMLLRAYNSYLDSSIGPHEPFEVWKERMRDPKPCGPAENKTTFEVPTFRFWMTCKNFLSLYFRFIRVQRQGNWPATKLAIRECCPWFFAADRTNYKRWTPVFYRDMTLLPVTHPTVDKAFNKGLFSIQRGSSKFSLMSMDQNMEHYIRFVKSEGGSKGLYGNQEERDVVEISRPVILEGLKKFEKEELGVDTDMKILEHPESSIAEQEKFKKDLDSLIRLVDEGRIINPFMETSSDLVTLDTGEVMDPLIARCMYEVEEIGETMCRQYIEERLKKAEKPISDTIPRAGLYTFSNRPPAENVKGKAQCSTKGQVALTTKLFMSLQARPDSDFNEFFKYENGRYPLNISDKAKLYQPGTKSDIIDCLPGMPQPGRNNDTKNVTAIIYDMAAIVHMVTPKKTKYFSEYPQKHLFKFFESQLSNYPQCKRIDGVWEVYKRASLKTQCRDHRTSSTRTNRVGDFIPIPKGKEWTKLLGDVSSKSALFPYCSEKLIPLFKDNNCDFVSNTGEETKSSNENMNLTELNPYGHEEADTGMFLRAKHAASMGHLKLLMRTVDSDIVIIAIFLFRQLELEELWIGYGKGKHYRDIPIHIICRNLGETKSLALPFFHALTGCDLTSAFKTIGKKTAWNIWEVNPDFSETFAQLTCDPSLLKIDSQQMQNVERFIALCFCKKTTEYGVNSARRKLFTVGLKTWENIPPSLHSLFQHTKRSCYVTCFQWKVSLEKYPVYVDPKPWGWQWNDRLKQYVPFWTELPDVSSACRMIASCGCKVACTGNCKCSRNNLRCSALCACEGTCMNDDD